MPQSDSNDFYAKLYHHAYHPAGFKRQLLAMICTGSLAEKLKQIKTRSLIIHGDYDPAFSIEHGKQLALCVSDNETKIC